MPRPALRQRLDRTSKRSIRPWKCWRTVPFHNKKAPRDHSLEKAPSWSTLVQGTRSLSQVRPPRAPSLELARRVTSTSASPIVGLAEFPLQRKPSISLTMLALVLHLEDAHMGRAAASIGWRICTPASKTFRGHGYSQTNTDTTAEADNCGKMLVAVAGDVVVTHGTAARRNRQGKARRNEQVRGCSM